MPICFRHYLLALICFAKASFFPLPPPPPYAHPLVYLDMLLVLAGGPGDAHWSRLSWLLAHMEPSLSTCTFIVPPDPTLRLLLFVLPCSHTHLQRIMRRFSVRPRPYGGHFYSLAIVPLTSPPPHKPSNLFFLSYCRPI
ncbi:hypothetical protein H4582DRAFT_278701 [Lactarius indigo]|nr:hypothetical protein H4582DRAFT_278701 [Lactarius indigo]